MEQSRLVSSLEKAALNKRFCGCSGFSSYCGVSPGNGDPYLLMTCLKLQSEVTICSSHLLPFPWEEKITCQRVSKQQEIFPETWHCCALAFNNKTWNNLRSKSQSRIYWTIAQYLGLKLGLHFALTALWNLLPAGWDLAKSLWMGWPIVCTHPPMY